MKTSIQTAIEKISLEKPSGGDEAYDSGFKEAIILALYILRESLPAEREQKINDYQSGIKEGINRANQHDIHVNPSDYFTNTYNDN